MEKISEVLYKSHVSGSYCSNLVYEDWAFIFSLFTGHRPGSQWPQKASEAKTPNKTRRQHDAEALIIVGTTYNYSSVWLSGAKCRQVARLKRWCRKVWGTCTRASKMGMWALPLWLKLQWGWRSLKKCRQVRELKIQTHSPQCAWQLEKSLTRPLKWGEVTVQHRNNTSEKRLRARYLLSGQIWPFCPELGIVLSAKKKIPFTGCKRLTSGEGP